MAEEVKLLGQIHALSMPSAAPLQLASHCPELLIVPILDAIRASLLQLRPSKDAEYNQFPDLVRRGIEHAISSAAAQHVLSAGQVPPSIDRSAQPSADFAVAHVSAVIERPLEDVPRPIHAPPPGSEAAESKFATFVHPSGTIEDYQKGLSSRIGFPHLQFYSAMEAEHSSMAGTSTPFTTRNYGITTTPQMEWLYVVHGDATPAEHMLHGRSIARVEDKLQCCQARKAGLRKEEVIAIILYTGPMYIIYNSVLAQWSSPPSVWNTLRDGGNLFTATLSVLVSAVQKLSAISAIPDGLKLYRGTGGLACLPAHFTNPDAYNCRGMTEWCFMSSSKQKSVAIQYSGVEQGRPHAMVLEIEPSRADRGAVVSEFSQYPGEEETLFLPMSYVQQNGPQRVEETAFGRVTIIPIRVNVNLKADCLEQLEQKKKIIHMTSFEFRVNELRQKLRDAAASGSADARFKMDQARQGKFWQKPHSVIGFIEALMSKVVEVVERHRARPASHYCDDAVYRSLVAESLEVAHMAQVTLRWWLTDDKQSIHVVQEFTLLRSLRRYESFLRLRYGSASSDDVRRTAALELCVARNLLISSVDEIDSNNETRLLTLAAGGGSAEDIELLIAAGANVHATNTEGASALLFAALQGHAEAIGCLICAGADCNQAAKLGATPIFVASLNGHAKCVHALLESGADANSARTGDGATALLVACQHGFSSIVQLLLRGGSDTKQADKDGTTPLMIACEYGNFDCAEKLINARADLTSLRQGQTPLDIALAQGHESIVQLIARALAAEAGGA